MHSIKAFLLHGFFFVGVLGIVPIGVAQQAFTCNLVSNGDFSAGGDFDSGSVPSWYIAFETPQLDPAPGCEGDPGFVSMWGNKQVGEAIKQKLANPIKKGHTYKLSACVRRVNYQYLPSYVRFNVRATQGPLASYSLPVGASQIGIIGDPSNTPSIAPPGIKSTTWTRVTLANWTAKADYDTITINPENNSMADSANEVSWGQIDRVCLQDLNNPCPPPDPDFTLTATLAVNSSNYSLTATAPPLPVGTNYYWRVEEVDSNGTPIQGKTLENSSAWWANPTSTDFSGYCCKPNMSSPAGAFQQGHRYQIVRGLWNQCVGWTEVRKTVFMCNNCRARDLQVAPSGAIQAQPSAPRAAGLAGPPSGRPSRTDSRDSTPAVR